MQEEVLRLISPGSMFPCGNPHTWERWMELFWLHASFLFFMSDTEIIHSLCCFNIKVKWQCSLLSGGLLLISLLCSCFFLYFNMELCSVVTIIYWVLLEFSTKQLQSFGICKENGWTTHSPCASFCISTGELQGKGARESFVVHLRGNKSLR